MKLYLIFVRRPTEISTFMETHGFTSLEDAMAFCNDKAKIWAGNNAELLIVECPIVEVFDVRKIK